MDTYKEKYLKYKAKYINLQNKLNKRGGGNNQVNIILFKADWCGHCKSFKPTWEKITELYNKKYNFIVYDADTQKEIFKKYEVDAFPTILIEYGDNVVPYEGDRSFEEMNDFLNNLKIVN
jgi:protein disulfide-isomerase A6